MPSIVDSPAFRHCRAKAVPKVSVAALRQVLLTGVGVEGGFLLNAANLPSEVRTTFALQVDDRQLLLGIQAASVPRSDSLVELEVLFGGEPGEFTQILLTEGGAPSYVEFLTGTKSVDSGYQRLRPSRIHWSAEGERRMFRDVFVFLWFSKKKVFGHGGRVGFNIVRNERALNEFSSWNLLAGAGSPDSQSLGTLLLPGVRAPLPPRFTAKPSKTFALQVTNDVLMCIIGRPYTPDRLQGEMKFLRERGVSRLSWIDYAGEVPLAPELAWAHDWRASHRACGGEPLRAAAKAAAKERVELVADYKLFDFVLTKYTSHKAGPGWIRLLENLHASCAAGLVDKTDWFVRSNAQWHRPRRYPLRVLRFYSRKPLPAYSEGALELFTSVDNHRFQPYRGTFTAKVERIRRPHASWSPAGPVASRGAESCYLLELSGLELETPFAALRWKTPGAQLTNLMFRLAEAEDADGQVHLFSLSNQRIGESFLFQQPWPGWGNHLERIVTEVTPSLEDVGLCFEEAEVLPGFLEVSHPEVHAFWLSSLDKLFSEGARGVCLRVQAHHYTCDSWLKFAFHPVVIQQFRERYGRDPLPREQDYARIRALRGEAFTAFLRRARALALKKKKRLLFQIEGGAELPPAIGSRLQFAYELETWIEERLFDEFVVRGPSPWAPWVRGWLLPRAQAAGVPVQWVTRNLEPGARILATRQAEILAQGAAVAREHGFSGISLYESMALYWANSGGRIVPQPGAEGLFEKVAEAAGIRRNNTCKLKIFA